MKPNAGVGETIAMVVDAKYIPQIFAESRQIGLIGGVVLQVAYAARLP